jgi:hypothetical protein
MVHSTLLSLQVRQMATIKLYGMVDQPLYVTNSQMGVAVSCRSLSKCFKEELALYVQQLGCV